MKETLNRAYIFALAWVFSFVQVCAQTPAGPQVELSLIVTDKGNKSVNTIRKDGIRVIEDKVEQTILSVDTDQRPIDFGLVIDSSGSFVRLIEAGLEAARLIIVNRRPADEIFIERFISSDKIQKVHDFSSDGNALVQALNTIQLEGGQSAVIDAVYIAAQYIAQHNATSAASRRKAVVIITDGEDRNSYYKIEHLTKLLVQENIQVFILGLTSELDRETSFIRRSPRERAQVLLKTIAEESGGRVFFPKDQAELTDATAEIIRNLHGQFRITYRSSNESRDKGFRKVEVKLVSNDAEERKAIAPRRYHVGPKDVPAKAKEQKSP